MTQTSRPWTGVITGDAGPYTDAQWRQLYQSIIGYGAGRANLGVLLSTGTQPFAALRVQAQSPTAAAVDVLTGAALVQGLAYINTATVSLAIAANSSGNPRIDTVVVRADYALQTARLTVVQGTPAVSPVAPSLTQIANVMWDIPLADIAVANGFVGLAQSTISQRQEYVNAPPVLFLDNVINNSGATLNDGDVVIWDTSADRAVTTTTLSENPLVAGTWRGRTAAGGYGRVQVQGIGYVNADAAITRGAYLVTSTTVRRAAARTVFPGHFARALETTSGAGMVLCEINARMVPGGYFMQTWSPFANPLIFDATAAFSTDQSLPANGGSIAIPMQVPSYMLLQSVSVINGDTATQRTWGWDLYKEIYNASASDATLTRVATGAANETFTPGGAASTRTIAAATPVYLEPGIYWLVVQNRHATNTFNFRNTAAARPIGNTSQTKTTSNPNGSTLDFVAATWTAQTFICAARLNGSVFGQGTAF